MQATMTATEFQDFLDQHRIKPTQLARDLGVHAKTVYQWRHDHPPSWIRHALAGYLLFRAGLTLG